MTEVGSTYSIKYKMMTTTIIIIVPCPSSSSWSLVISMRHLCPFVGAGHRLWAVVGGGRGPWFVFWGWRPFLCWPSFVFVLGGLSSFLGGREWSSAMVVRWHRRGGRAVVGCHWGCRWCGVVVVVVVGDKRRPHHMVFGWWFVW